MFDLDSFPEVPKGTSMVLNKWMLEGKGIVVGNTMYLAPDVWVEVLMMADGEEFKDEPGKAVYSAHGFNEESVWICAQHAKATAHRNIERLFMGLELKIALMNNWIENSPAFA